MKPSELFSDKDKTKELLYGQENVNCSSETTTGKEKAKKVPPSDDQCCCPYQINFRLIPNVAIKSLAVMHDKNYQKIRILVFYLLAGVLY